MELVITLAILVTILICLYRYLTRNYDYWKNKGIPCLDGTLPGIGNVTPLLLLRENLPMMCERFYNSMPEYSMFGYYHLTTPALLLREPALAKIVLVDHFQDFSANKIILDAELDPLLSTHPFFCNGTIWKASRIRATHAFSSRKLKVVSHVMRDVSDKLDRYLSNKLRKIDDVGSGCGNSVELELKDLFSRYTGEVAASAAFGADGQNFADEGQKESFFRQTVELVFRPSIIKGIEQLIVFFLPRLAKILRMRLIPKEADTFFRKTTSDILRVKKQNAVTDDYMQVAILQNITLSNDNVDEDLVTTYSTQLFFDAYETSSITLSFLAYTIASDQEVQNKLRREIHDVLSRHNGEITYDALKEMTYMDQVLNESMRLYHVAGIILRVCTRETVLTGSDGLSCRVDPGVIIAIPIQGFHMDPKYFPDPQRFDPDRFSKERNSDRYPYSFLPFGEGPRNCVGKRFALISLKTAMSTILRHYSIEVSPRTRTPLKRDPRLFMSTVTGGLWIYLKPLT